MITIFASSKGIDVSEFAPDITITDNIDYISTYARIVESIHEKKDLCVNVIDTLSSARWLETLAQKYGTNLVTFKTVTLKKKLEERIGITIDPNIRDADLLDSGLMDVNIPVSGRVDFSSYLLAVFMGEFLVKPEMILRTTEIVAGFRPDQWEEALQKRLIKRAYDRNLIQIKSGYSSRKHSAELQLIEWFEQSPQVYIQRLADLRLLQNYPLELGIREFNSVYKPLIELNLDLRKIPFASHVNESVIREIGIYINKTYVLAEKPDFNRLIEEASGLLKIELEAIIRLIKTGKVNLDEQLVKKIHRKFSLIREDPYAQEILEEISNYIAVPIPSEPKDEWNEKEWIEWSLNEYLPYRFWLEDTNQINDEIGIIAGKFGDWLFQHYGNLLYNSDSMAWKKVLNLRESIRNNDGPVLFVMIDNFNSKFFNYFRNEMQHQAFHEQKIEFGFATLPTFTEISKKSIISGHYAPFSGTEYSRNIETSWNSRVNKRIKYIPNIQELRKISQRDFDVYFLNYLPVDIILHEHESHLGISHTRTVKTFLNALANDIRSFARNINADSNLLVIVTSDHGSTRIPKGLTNVLNNSFYKKRALDEHHRFITISDTETTKLSDDFRYDCYLFNKREFELPENYLVARKLARFLATDDTVYVHGGLTPEETLVPVAVFLPVTVTPKPLILKLLAPSEILIGAKQSLKFEITNPNTYPIENIKLEFLDRIIDGEFIEIDALPKLDRLTALVDIRCLNQVDSSTDSINIRVAYQFNGQVFESNENIQARFKSLITTKFNLDDL